MSPFIALWASAALWFSAGAPITTDCLCFSPKDGTKSRKHLRIQACIVPQATVFTINGTQVPEEVVNGLNEHASLQFALDIDSTETFMATRRGQPLELLRAYELIRTSAMSPSSRPCLETPSRLEGQTVRFAWNDATQSYVKSLLGQEPEGIDLGDLLDDMEVRTLLPKHSVSPGDAWTVKSTSLMGLFLPGGPPSPVKDKGADLEIMVRGLISPLESARNSVLVTCTFVGTKQVLGMTVAEVSIALAGTCRFDGLPLLRCVAAWVQGMPVIDSTADARVAITAQVEGAGVLLWNCSSGTMHSYQMKTTAGVDVIANVHSGSKGEKRDVSLAMTLKTSTDWTLKATRP